MQLLYPLYVSFLYLDFLGNYYFKISLGKNKNTNSFWINNNK